jgi:hypothetical protein
MLQNRQAGTLCMYRTVFKHLLLYVFEYMQYVLLRNDCVFSYEKLFFFAFDIFRELRV